MNDENSLRILERKIIRQVYGPVFLFVVHRCFLHYRTLTSKPLVTLEVRQKIKISNFIYTIISFARVPTSWVSKKSILPPSPSGSGSQRKEGIVGLVHVYFEK